MVTLLFKQSIGRDREHHCFMRSGESVANKGSMCSFGIFKVLLTPSLQLGQKSALHHIWDGHACHISNVANYYKMFLAVNSTQLSCIMYKNMKDYILH